MVGQAGIHDSAEERVRSVFSGGGRNPGRCASSANALPWAPAFAGEQLSGECDR